MKKVFAFIPNLFEEIELITPIDILRRGGLDVITVSLEDTKEVIGSHNITIHCDTRLEDNDYSSADILILPGGPGYKKYFEIPDLADIIKRHMEEGRLVAAICAAPTYLAQAGLIKGYKACCYIGMEGDLVDTIVSYNSVTRDRNVITARGAGVALDFSLEIISYAFGDNAAKELSESIVFSK